MNENFIDQIKNRFPIFKNNIRKNSFYYLDNAAITHVPDVVISSLNDFYTKINSNIRRSAYFLSEQATEEYDKTREKIADFLGVKNKNNCIFVKNTTEGINLVATSYLRPKLKENDEIVISTMEHHSNIVPWYILANEKKAKLKIIPLLESGDLDYKNLDKLLTIKTKILAITHISNAIGTINDIKSIINLAHKKDIPVLIDGAQSLLNNLINIEDLDCDFFVMSSHKCYGPNGVGVLYAKKKMLDEMEPYQGGGEMIKSVNFTKISWNDIPYKFEAGTQSIANIIAFGKTIDFLNSLDLNAFFSYKKELTDYALNRLEALKDIKIIGHPNNRSAIISFVINNIHSHDFGTIANHYGVCVRTGHHCAMPLMNFYNVSSTIRLSMGIYNLKTDIDKLIFSIKEAQNIFYQK